MIFKVNDGKEQWNVEVKNAKNFGSHYELRLSARGSGITVFFGHASYGQWFIAVPDWEASVVVGNLQDTYYAAEKLGRAMESEIDGWSVAAALIAYAKQEGINEVDGHQEVLDEMKAAGYVIIDPEDN
ncbi:hypothetical protein M5X00_24125 [Paenibacillus alvei]|uniref:Phage protein n=1 Tax=Paenibacillus alvei TaxID=44250 RepID=A0ABT4GR29_PAEAL|nr:DUF6618 family protein [Paenibacillus alvei]MCY9543607.1 hypothetical protein [Paenibacillus alvei]MCY9737323.1 hypothetical protein [Paenibacillus alvei]MCY9757317.1 hypothetical protein [Paenibacillus alvei]MCY9759152.1 hypothetical protein [Paenibacillus alvei]MCY9770389.1 hypothetical protein [Paenibacillus alvei]